MAIQLICIDMDGTLLMNQHDIALVDQEAIEYALNQGVHVAITTGRVYNCARLYAKRIGLQTPIIASNGAFIGGVEDEVIYHNPLDLQDVHDFMTLTEQAGVLSYLTANFGIISTVELPETNIYKVLNQTLPESEKIRLEVISSLEELSQYEQDILKGVCIGEDHSLLVELKEKLKKTHPHLEVVSSWNDNFEIMKKGSSKGEAVQHLADYLNISYDDVMCIGDSENDLSMLEVAGVSVAMGNATPEVKEQADYITADNQHGGVAQAIYHFIK